MATVAVGAAKGCVNVSGGECGLCPHRERAHTFAINKADGGAFSADDEKLAHMLTDHIAIFSDAIGGGAVPAAV